MKARQQENASAKRSEKRRLLRVKNKTDETTCFACREKGHSVKDCPQNADSNTIASGICFRFVIIKLKPSKFLTNHTGAAARSTAYPSAKSLYLMILRTLCHLRHVSFARVRDISRLDAPQTKRKASTQMAALAKYVARRVILPRIVKSGHQVYLPTLLSLGSNGPIFPEPQKDSILVGSGTNAGADEDDFHVVSRGRKEVNEEEGVKKPRGKIKKLVGGKIIVRVDDEPPKPVARKPPPPAPVAKVKTVVF
jgi:zinc finger CCHC domain-containing protein 9